MIKKLTNICLDPKSNNKDNQNYKT